MVLILIKRKDGNSSRICASHQNSDEKERWEIFHLLITRPHVAPTAEILSLFMWACGKLFAQVMFDE